MEPETAEKKGKKGGSHRRKGGEPSEFEAEITLHLDEFFRFLNCYYPGKNKDDIISIPPNTQINASAATPTG